MTEPIFLLGLSILLVAVCLAAVLVVAIPTFLELARVARSAEKLMDTLHRELPPTLEALRRTGVELGDLAEDVSESVESAGNVAKQVDQSIKSTKHQVQQAQITTRSVMAGVRIAWKTLVSPQRQNPRSPHRPSPSPQATGDRTSMQTEPRVSPIENGISDPSPLPLNQDKPSSSTSEHKDERVGESPPPASQNKSGG